MRKSLLPSKSLFLLLLATCLSSFGTLLNAQTAQAESPETAPPELSRTIAELDAAANRRDINAVMRFYSPNFSDADGLNRQSLQQAIQNIWQRYGQLSYKTQLESWERQGDRYIAQVKTQIIGVQTQNGAPVNLQATLSARQNFQIAVAVPNPIPNSAPNPAPNSVPNRAPNPASRATPNRAPSPASRATPNRAPNPASRPTSNPAPNSPNPAPNAATPSTANLGSSASPALQIAQQEVLAERSQVTSGTNPPKLEVSLPERVGVGQEYSLDALVTEPLGDSLLLGTALEETVSAANYFNNRPVTLELLSAGGVFKVGQAPRQQGSRWVSVIVVSDGGLTQVSQRLRVVSEQSATVPTLSPAVSAVSEAPALAPTPTVVAPVEQSFEAFFSAQPFAQPHL
ncbi:hypothetical protein [Leptolyngbya sp. FACHB-261]|uniref:hypothetical protein n=1 Tax=Leptolyngbya sp. FACHB-261 TaxID=2692806 RepID=UPI00168834F5|nr:hypothetical protein [Leptolyngbya sp. FACHB-261]MBD2099657.1 hypothetical protein [Leptolyngbya sp. FACHB-261]